MKPLVNKYIWKEAVLEGGGVMKKVDVSWVSPFEQWVVLNS